MAIIRRYFDESEWEAVDEQSARQILGRNFVDVDLALEDIAAGRVLRTVAAEYKHGPGEALRQQKEE